MINQVPSVYEAFNARSLTNKELCETFIVNDHFQELASPNHTIVIGPRGSGKTTLMRMLQVEALDIWADGLADEYRSSVSFSGVFIPTDRFWKSQFDRIKARIGLSERERSLLTSMFTYHAIEKLASTVSYRVKGGQGFKFSKIEKSDEAELVGALADLWKVKPAIRSLRSLEVAITIKKKEISDYISLLVDGKSKSPEIAGGDLVSLLGASVKIINTYLSDKGGKWCFLFDELELAPEEIIQPLVDSMRGGPEDVILKLSLSPYHRDLSVTVSSESAMNRQDLSFINLTGLSDKKGLDFSARLCGNIFKKHGLNESVESYFDAPKPINEKKVFRELSEKDPTFDSYLKANEISIGLLDKYTENDKRPTVRKIKFVANLRNYYRKQGRLASRKIPPSIYAGFPGLCQAMEYNPRMLIGLMNKFIGLAKDGEKIKVSDQLPRLAESFNSFKALLETIAIEGDGVPYDTIYDLIEVIAKRFKNDIVGEKFIAEPKGTITFKRDENLGYLDAIGYALNAGAMIIDKSRDEPFYNLDGIRSARCRLSYIFSHNFGLLTTKPREIELVDVVSHKKRVSLKVVDPVEEGLGKTATPGQMELL